MLQSWTEGAAEKQIATLQVELSAARDGTFLQDAYNDAAYSQQARRRSASGYGSPTCKLKHSSRTTCLKLL